VDRNVLLSKLPPFSNRSLTIKNTQTVSDIVKEVLAAHEAFAPDYDLIADNFNYPASLEIAKALFDFCKKNIHYRVEKESKQTTKSPSAILTVGEGDCKHYASFIAGVLDALNRKGRKIDWWYRFAGYNLFDPEPGHVFVVMKDRGKEIWIDPVLKSFDERLEPTYIVDKRPKNNFMLQRISGIDDELFNVLDEEDRELSPELLQAIELLLQYKVIDTEGRVNDVVLTSLERQLSREDFERIANARILLHTSTVSGFFSDVWRGVKKVSLSIPRNAYLSMVALNVFGYATKLHTAIYNSDNSYSQPGQDKLYTKWRSLGGDWQALENAIKSGFKKPQILAGTIGVAEAAGPAAWALTASVIIAAMTPLLKDILGSKSADAYVPINDNVGPYGYCDDGITPRNADGTCPSDNSKGGFDFMQFIKDNPMVVAIAAVGGYFLFFDKPQKHRA
jgi:hypothetical protein